MKFTLLIVAAALLGNAQATRTGAGSPVGRDACATAGETYLQTDASPGSNLFTCSVAGAPGTWTLSDGRGAPAALYSSGHAAGTTFVAIEQCRDDSFTITTEFRQAAQTAAVALATIAPFGEVRTARIIEARTVTAGANVTGVAACIGTSGTPCGYAGPFPLMGASRPAFRSYTASGSLAATDNGTQALQLQLTVTGGSGNLSALTGGVVKTRVCAVIGQ
jgi:hypothetical protein